MACGCSQTTDTPASLCGPPFTNCCECTDDNCQECLDCNAGCDVNINAECVTSTKDLPGIGLTGENDLQFVLERIDDVLSATNPLNLNGIAFGYLGQKYDITSFKNFAEAVVTELTLIKEDIEELQNINIANCFNFTIRNTGTSVGYYDMINCQGIKFLNQPLAAGNSIAVLAKGVRGNTNNILVTNNGTLSF